MEEQPINDQNHTEVPDSSISDLASAEELEQLRRQQNLPFGIAGGMAAAILGALLWAVITVILNYQIGYMAVAVGFVVGMAMRFTGKGIDAIFGYLGSLFALLGCLLGNFLTVVHDLAQANELRYIEVLQQMDYSKLPSLMLELASPIDLLFYAIAIYEGYRFALLPINQDEEDV